MSQHITAIYEHGLLRPLTPLDLQDQEMVSLVIDKVSQPSDVDAAEPTLFVVLDEVGLVGCIKDAPPDLSSNPQHMEGFGKSGK